MTTAPITAYTSGMLKATALELTVQLTNFVKIAQRIHTYIPHFGQILVKISVLGAYTLIFVPMGVKFGTEDGTAPPCQISPPLVQHYHSTVCRMKIIIIGRLSLTISAILAAILDS